MFSILQSFISKSPRCWSATTSTIPSLAAKRTWSPFARCPRWRTYIGGNGSPEGPQTTCAHPELVHPPPDSQMAGRPPRVVTSSVVILDTSLQLVRLHKAPKALCRSILLREYNAMSGSPQGACTALWVKGRVTDASTYHWTAYRPSPTVVVKYGFGLALVVTIPAALSFAEDYGHHLPPSLNLLDWHSNLPAALYAGEPLIYPTPGPHSPPLPRGSMYLPWEVRPAALHNRQWVKHQAQSPSRTPWSCISLSAETLSH